MKSITRTFVILAGLTLATASAVSAQSQDTGSAGPGRWEISAFPGGGVFFTKGSDGNAPDFGEYVLGASATFNVNRWIGLEGEIGGGVSVRQDLSFRAATLRDTRVPHTLAYNGNVAFSPLGSDHRLVPYVTGGGGGFTVFSRDEVSQLGVAHDETFFTGNVGGGVKWFASRHVGVRADYRFIAIRSKDDAPAFFGLNETRYGHRIYGGIVLTGGR
jgi:opacity protein-like surface antigen